MKEQYLYFCPKCDEWYYSSKEQAMLKCPKCDRLLRFTNVTSEQFRTMSSSEIASLKRNFLSSPNAAPDRTDASSRKTSSNASQNSAPLSTSQTSSDAWRKNASPSVNQASSDAWRDNASPSVSQPSSGASRDNAPPSVNQPNSGTSRDNAPPSTNQASSGTSRNDAPPTSTNQASSNASQVNIPGSVDDSSFWIKLMVAPSALLIIVFIIIGCVFILPMLRLDGFMSIFAFLLVILAAFMLVAPAIVFAGMAKDLKAIRQLLEKKL